LGGRGISPHIVIDQLLPNETHRRKIAITQGLQQFQIKAGKNSRPESGLMKTAPVRAQSASEELN
jgi:hypothetical protein